MVSESEATKQLGMPSDQDSIPNATNNTPNNNIPTGQQPAPADGQGPGDQSQGNAGEWSSDWF